MWWESSPSPRRRGTAGPPPSRPAARPGPACGRGGRAQAARPVGGQGERSLRALPAARNHSAPGPGSPPCSHPPGFRVQEEDGALRRETGGAEGPVQARLPTCSGRPLVQDHLPTLTPGLCSGPAPGLRAPAGGMAGRRASFRPTERQDWDELAPQPPGGRAGAPPPPRQAPLRPPVCCGC